MQEEMEPHEGRRGDEPVFQLGLTELMLRVKAQWVAFLMNRGAQVVTSTSFHSVAQTRHERALACRVGPPTRRRVQTRESGSLRPFPRWARALSSHLLHPTWE